MELQQTQCFISREKVGKERTKKEGDNESERKREREQNWHLLK